MSTGIPPLGQLVAILSLSLQWRLLLIPVFLIS